jgi:hypothetical protein
LEWEGLPDLGALRAAQRLAEAATADGWQTALTLLARLQDRGLTPDVHSYTAAIHACRVAGQWDKALELLEWGATSRSGVMYTLWQSLYAEKRQQELAESEAAKGLRLGGARGGGALAGRARRRTPVAAVVAVGARPATRPQRGLGRADSGAGTAL